MWRRYLRFWGDDAPSDIDNEIVFTEAEHLGRLGIELSKVVAQQLGHAAGVGIFRWKDDDRVDREAELHELAVTAVE